MEDIRSLVLDIKSILEINRPRHVDQDIYKNEIVLQGTHAEETAGYLERILKKDYDIIYTNGNTEIIESKKPIVVFIGEDSDITQKLDKEINIRKIKKIVIDPDKNTRLSKETYTVDTDIFY